MNKTNDTPKRDQPSQPKPSSGGSPASPGASGAGASRGWILPLVVISLVVAACVLIGVAVAKRAGTRDANRLESAPASPAESVSTPASNAPPAASAPAVANSNSPPATSAPSLKLQGIVYDTVRPWAIVDGKTVYPGSRVGDYRVKEISQNTVTLEDTNGSLRTLFLGK